MSLIIRKKIHIGTDEDGNEVAVKVRALSAQDIGFIYANDSEAFSALFEGFFNQDSGEELLKIITYQVTTAAGLIIALAADDIDNLDEYLHLPFPIQVEILQEVYRLTSPSDDAKKKAVEGLEVMVGMLLKSGLTSLQPSEGGSD